MELNEAPKTSYFFIGGKNGKLSGDTFKCIQRSLSFSLVIGSDYSIFNVAVRELLSARSLLLSQPKLVLIHLG